jgi:hypothetical protein
MPSSLLACLNCSRHIRSTEPSCPFCQCVRPPSAGVAAALPLPRGRLSRAALAFGASTLAVASLACGGATSSGNLDEEAGVIDGAGAKDAAHDGHCMSAALYGGFPGEPCIGERDAEAEDGSPSDAGTGDGESPNPTDAALPPNYCDVISHAAYGAPPPECQ